MPINDDVVWMCIVETPDGDRHIMKLSGVNNEATIRQHAGQIDRKNKILVLKRATLEEIQAEADKLNADPSHIPVTDMNNIVPQDSEQIGGTSPAAPPKTFA